MNDVITDKSAFTKVLITLLVLGCVLVLAKTLNEFKRGGYIGRDVAVQNTITVKAEGEVFVKPDIATFSYSVTEEGKTVGEAQKKATAKSNTAIALLKDGGVAEKDIKTINYNINPKYEYYYQPAISMPCRIDYCPPQPVKDPKIVGYEVTQTMEVKVRDIESAGELLSSIGTVGVQNVSGLNFSIDDEEKVMAEAREEAIKLARAKAKVLARDLGVTLVRITNFTEGNDYPIYFRTEAAVGNTAKDAAVAPSIPAGENRIVSNVTITYEIR